MPIQRNDEKYRIAKKKGYRSTKDGNIIGVSGRILKGKKNNKGYRLFDISVDGEYLSILFHRFIAYEKYGEQLFEEGIARHLDGNPLNNKWDNIAIGTQADNMGDIPIEEVYEKAKTVGLKIRKYDYEEIREYYHNNDISVEELTRIFDIKTSSTALYILKTDKKRDHEINRRKYDYEEIIEYYNNNQVTIGDVRKKFNLCNDYYVIRILKTDPDFKKKYDKSKNYEEIKKNVINFFLNNPYVGNKKIAKKFNISESYTSKILNTHPKTKDKNKRLKYDYEEIRYFYKKKENVTFKDICKEFGCSINTAKRIINSDSDIT